MLRLYIRLYAVCTQLYVGFIRPHEASVFLLVMAPVISRSKAANYHPVSGTR